MLLEGRHRQVFYKKPDSSSLAFIRCSSLVHVHYKSARHYSNAGSMLGHQVCRRWPAFIQHRTVHRAFLCAARLQCTWTHDTLTQCRLNVVPVMETLNQRWINAGPPSVTLAQPGSSIVPRSTRIHQEGAMRVNVHVSSARTKAEALKPKAEWPTLKQVPKFQCKFRSSEVPGTSSSRFSSSGNFNFRNSEIKVEKNVFFYFTKKYFAFPRNIDCQAARMNGIECGFLDRVH